jgi:thiol-disulfide isomerase/thioredoxin
MVHPPYPKRQANSMKTFLASHNDCFRAEWLKLKRTGILWLCIAAAAFIPILITVITIFVNQNDPSNDNAWKTMLSNCFTAFTGFFFPLFMVITMVRIVYIEHRSDTWKLMETQPVSRVSLYVVKYEVAILVSLLCLLCLFAFALIGGIILQYAKPEIGFSRSSVDWTGTLAIIIRYWVASLGLIAVQYFLALLIRSFAWPLTIGLIAIIVGSILSGFGVATWFPYSALSATSASLANGNPAGHFLLYHEKLSILWALLFLVLGYILFRRRSFSKAFFTPVKQLAIFVGIIIVFAFIFWWINKPVVLDRYNKTVIAGRIVSEKPAQNFILGRTLSRDTIVSGKIVNGQFKALIPAGLPAGMYFFKAGQFGKEIYLSENDSLYLDIETTKTKNNIRYGGTRKAENEFLDRNRNNFWMLENYGYEYSPATYASSVMDEWSAGVKKLGRFKTLENIQLAPDFIAMQKKLLATDLLYLTDIKYPRMFAVYHPNDTLKFPRSIDKLRAEVTTSDSTLVSHPNYLRYVSDYYQSKSAGTKNRDSAFFNSVLTIPSPQVREAVLFSSLRERITMITDSTRRSMMMAMLDPYFNTPVYRKSLSDLMKQLNNVRRGAPAPDISSEALNGKEYHLADLSRRYIVIDVWATWCGPCKGEAPYFEQYSDRYTSEHVAFVSLSIDEDKNAWKMAASQKRGSVLQLWAKNGPDELDKKYAVTSIPRFILIDPKGNIVNAQLPPPSDPEFEVALLKEISFLNN